MSDPRYRRDGMAVRGEGDEPILFVYQSDPAALAEVDELLDRANREPSTPAELATMAEELRLIAKSHSVYPASISARILTEWAAIAERYLPPSPPSAEELARAYRDAWTGLVPAQVEWDGITPESRDAHLQVAQRVLDKFAGGLAVSPDRPAPEIRAVADLLRQEALIEKRQERPLRAEWFDGLADKLDPKPEPVTKRAADLTEGVDKIGKYLISTVFKGHGYDGGGPTDTLLFVEATGVNGQMLGRWAPDTLVTLGGES